MTLLHFAAGVGSFAAVSAVVAAALIATLLGLAHLEP
jgi:hypothetical protein